MDAPELTTSSPRSPSAGARLEDCMEELLKFTILSSLRGRLRLGIPDAYCVDLLRDDHSDFAPRAHVEVCANACFPPMYKYLASILCKTIHTGIICMENENLEPRDESFSSRNEYEEWNNIIAEKGPALLSLLEKVDFKLHVQEPFFSQIYDGMKTVEGRCAVGDYKRIKSGDLLLVNKCLTLQVQDIRSYPSFREMLEAETLDKVLPGVQSLDEGVQIYRNFYSEEKERSNGVLAIHVKRSSPQLYETMASIISGLKSDGVQMLLRRTTEQIVD